MWQIASTLALKSSFCCSTSSIVRLKPWAFGGGPTDPILYYWIELYGYRETTYYLVRTLEDFHISRFSKPVSHMKRSYLPYKRVIMENLNLHKSKRKTATDLYCNLTTCFEVNSIHDNDPKHRSFFMSLVLTSISRWLCQSENNKPWKEIFNVALVWLLHIKWNWEWMCLNDSLQSIFKVSNPACFVELCTAVVLLHNINYIRPNEIEA